jgi:hypothetical protein
MSVRLAQRSCSTRVPRVQFGVPPNCGGTCGYALVRPRHQQRHRSPVSGVTPETTRETRVLQLRIGSSRHA